MKISIVCLTVNLVCRPAGRAVAAGRTWHCNTITSVCNAGCVLCAAEKLGKLEMESLRATFCRWLSPAFWPGWWHGRAGVLENFLATRPRVKMGAVFVPAGLAGLIMASSRWRSNSGGKGNGRIRTGAIQK